MGPLARMLASMTLFWPAVALADRHCDIIINLSQMHAAQTRLIGPSPRGVAQDLAVLRGGLKRMDNANIQWALRDTASDGEITALQLFISLARIGLAQTEQGQPVSAYAARPDFMRNQSAVSRILPQLTCRDWPDATSAATASGRPPSPEQTQKSRVIGIGFAVLPYVISAFAIGLGYLGAKVFGRIRAVRSRRARRYHVSHHSRYRLNNADFDAEMIDISQNGIKFRHQPEHHLTTGDTVGFLLGDVWHTSRIIWQNGHYCGARFTRRIPAARLAALLESFKIAKKGNGK